MWQTHYDITRVFWEECSRIWIIVSNLVVIDFFINPELKMSLVVWELLTIIMFRC